MKNGSQNEIRRMIDDFAEKLQAIVRQSTLQDVLSTLGGSAGVRRGPGRPKGSGRGPGRPPKSAGGRVRRSTEGLEKISASLLDYVAKHPGQRGEQIAKALRTDVGTMRLPMKKLIAEKRIRTEGQRRGMTYFPGGARTMAASSAKARRRGPRATRKKARRGARPKRVAAKAA